MDEFLTASDIIGLRACAALETRVFINEYSDLVISSPNEPGIAYFMVAGCYMQPEKGSATANTLEIMRNMAKNRNLQMIERINKYLDKVKLDYEKEVMPLTPSGNATERHILAAYDVKSRRVFKSDESELVEFWANIFKISIEECIDLLKDTTKLHEKMRSVLMKFGGIGYVSPNADTFPTVEKVIEMAKGMQALPTATWLDGTNEGEADMPKMLGLLVDKGVVALNIIPERNWNIQNTEEKKLKVENLEKVIAAAREANLPICIGTEMNKGGLPFVDDFSAPELKPYIKDFIDGAYFFWGHTFLARTAGIGYMSKWADSIFGEDRNKKNDFFISVGKIADPVESKEKLANMDATKATPEYIIETLSE